MSRRSSRRTSAGDSDGTNGTTYSNNSDRRATTTPSRSPLNKQLEDLNELLPQIQQEAAPHLKRSRGTTIPMVTKETIANAEKYIENCAKFEIKVDPNVVVALRTGWSLLQPSSNFSEGSLLPLMDILKQDTTIDKVNLSASSMHDGRFRAAGNGNSNARVLNSILRENTSIKDLDLSYTGLDDDGITEICEGLQENDAVVNLNLSSNHFGEVGADRLRQVIEKNETLRFIDVSRNALGFRSINSLLCSCAPRGLALQTNGNFVFEEILNSVSHGLAFLASIIAANLLITQSVDMDHSTDYHFWACTLYSFALMFLFLSSCLFHSFFMLPSTSRILQILDHVGIYCVIAGTYTPFLLITLNHSTAARILLVGEWMAAALGSTFAACSDLNSKTTNNVELSFFLLMGWGVVLVWNEMREVLDPNAFFLLFLGGATYIVGIAFFILGERRPIYHCVWHLFVVLAASLHWFAIFFYVVPKPIVGLGK